MYLQDLTKLAMEEVIPANEGALGDNEWVRRLRNAMLIAGGVGLGTAAGTAAASYLAPQLPAALKSTWLPTGIGLSAGALSWLKSERDRKRDQDIQEANANRVLLRVQPGEEERVRTILQEIQPQKTPISVHMTSQTGPLDPKFRREVMVPPEATDRDLGETIWGTKTAYAAAPIEFLKVAVGLADLRKAYKVKAKQQPVIKNRSMSPMGHLQSLKENRGVSATALRHRPPSHKEHMMMDALVSGGEHGIRDAQYIDRTFSSIPNYGRDIIVQGGDNAKQVERLAKSTGMDVKPLNPKNREAFNRTTFLHENKELNPGPGVFEFSGHTNLQPMLQDLNIAATSTPDIQGSADMIRTIRKDEVSDLGKMVPGVERLNLGKERISRHARKRLQEAYDRNIMKELGPDKTPISTWSEGATQRVGDYNEYNRVRREMFPDAPSLPEMAHRGLQKLRGQSVKKAALSPLAMQSLMGGGLGVLGGAIVGNEMEHPFLGALAGGAAGAGLGYGFGKLYPMSVPTPPASATATKATPKPRTTGRAGDTGVGRPVQAPKSGIREGDAGVDWRTLT